MRISYHLDDFLFDSEYCFPKSLSEVAHFVRAQDDYMSIIMLAKNSCRESRKVHLKINGRQEWRSVAYYR